MRRAYVLLITGVVFAVFLLISALLARIFSADSAERAAIITVLQDEAQGNTNALISRIHDCQSSPACRRQAAENARRLKGAGQVSVLTLQTAAGGFTLGNTEGVARVAWRIGSGLPIVQCVRVRRVGNPITGLHVELLAVSKRIPSESSCPESF
ncbi:MAG TPA: hypothetical protein VE571_06570 [Solirubrobacteraceae bacterium]|jgi:hypothetical protein|nr:hypothetical protein [Solirubrobacteraceae bacterium]